MLCLRIYKFPFDTPFLIVYNQIYFYLHKEKLEERYCIIDFSYKEFESILKEENLLEIIDEQIKSLQFDTDYSCHLSKHPAEEKERQPSPK